MSDTDIQTPSPFIKAKLKRRLSEAEFSLTESVQMMITVTPPVGTKREEMLEPIFWSHVARRMKPMTEIRAMPRDGAWYGIYLVIYADHLQAKLKEIGFWDLDTLSEPESETDEYDVKWISPPVRFGVIRKSDKSVIKDKFQTKEQAYAWKNQNLPSKAA